jgi:hypothetical protein
MTGENEEHPTPAGPPLRAKVLVPTHHQRIYSAFKRLIKKYK